MPAALGGHMPQVDCVLDVQHRSRLDMMDAALRAIGRQLHVTAADTADPGRGGRNRRDGQPALGRRPTPQQRLHPMDTIFWKAIDKMKPLMNELKGSEERSWDDSSDAPSKRRVRLLREGQPDIRRPFE